MNSRLLQSLCRALVPLMLVGGIAACGDASDSTATTRPTAPPLATSTPIRGIAVLWYDNPDDSLEMVRTKAERVFAYAADLGANTVMLNIPFYTPDYQANSVGTGPSTPTPQRVAMAAEVAGRHKLTFAVRFLMDEKSLGVVGKWRGELEPTNRSAWFASYAALLGQYSIPLQKAGVSELVIAAELSSLDNDPNWASLIETIRLSFKGRLSQSVNWDHQEASFLSSQLPTGIDAYIPVDLPATASVSELETELEVQLSKLSSREGGAKGLILHEAGIASEGHHYADPWAGDTGGAVNLEAQRRWTQALCQAATTAGLGGIYWWKLDFHVDVVAPQLTDTSHSFVGKPAAQAIKACFGT